MINSNFFINRTNSCKSGYFWWGGFFYRDTEYEQTKKRITGVCQRTSKHQRTGFERVKPMRRRSYTTEIMNRRLYPRTLRTWISVSSYKYSTGAIKVCIFNAVLGCKITIHSLQIKFISLFYLAKHSHHLQPRARW